MPDMYNPNSLNALFTLDKGFHNALKNENIVRERNITNLLPAKICVNKCQSKVTKHRSPTQYHISPKPPPPFFGIRINGPYHKRYRGTEEKH